LPDRGRLDAGTSGRTELFADYKAQRRSRPDLLKQQWPAMEPLVEAFGYSNVARGGLRGDDLIASLATAPADQPPLPVMIVTGDRDVFQLIDDDGLVKVMATSRGITTRRSTTARPSWTIWHRARADPDFYGLKATPPTTSPASRIGDKTAASCSRAFGSLEGVLATSSRSADRSAYQNRRSDSDYALGR